MTKFTQLNLKAKPGNGSPKQSDSSARQLLSSSRTKTAMFTGLLTIGIVSGAALLALNGCSKKEPVKSEATTTIPSTMSTSAAVNTPALPAPSETPKPVKKVKKSSSVTYVNRTYGLSLQYPRKYSLKTGDDAQLEVNGSAVPMNFVKPGGVSVAAIEMPRGMYPGTDLNAAFLTVNVNRNLTASECDFAVPQASGSEVKPVSDDKSISDGKPVSPEKVKIGSREFSQVEKFEGDPMKQSEAKYYHAFENGACYEFALGLGTGINGAENEIKPVDRDAVFSKLEKILATVKIKGPVAPTESPKQVVGDSSVPAAQPANMNSPTSQVVEQKFEPTPVHPED